MSLRSIALRRVHPSQQDSPPSSTDVPIAVLFRPSWSVVALATSAVPSSPGTDPGSSSRTQAPLCGSLLAVAMPPCVAAIAFTMARPRPGSAVAPRAAGIGTAEAFEGVGQEVGGEARTIVGYLDDQVMVPSTVRAEVTMSVPAGANRRALSTRVVHGLADAIGVDPQVSPSRCLDPAGHSGIASSTGGSVGALAQQPGHVGRLELQGN